MAELVPVLGEVPVPSVWHLVRVIVRFRLRSVWNTVWRSPRGRSFRLAWLFVLLTPIAYAGLMRTALLTIAAVGGRQVQVAALAAVAGTIVLASLVGKMASGDAVVAGSGENEFYLTRPVRLSRLVLVRGLAGAMTDFFDALFLLPVLVAAALVWDLGVAGVALAALTSILVQVGVSAAAQAGQVLIVRLVPARRRRAAWAVLAVTAALAMAVLWMLATWVLRRPAAAVDMLTPWVQVIRWTPAGAIVAPLAGLAFGGWAAALTALVSVGLLTAAVAVLAVAAVAWAGRGGWEGAGAPWAEAARGVAAASDLSSRVSSRGRALGVVGKDWRLLVRDPSRLLRLIAMPLVFLGVQIFGSAGWTWSTADAHNVALVSFSLSAYAATFGPLGHMESERRAFWLLRSVPVSLSRLMVGKALFWSAIIGGMGALAYAVMTVLGHAPVSAETLSLGILVVVGGVAISWLAVAMACGAADLTDDARSALSPPTVYLFMLVAGLYNVVLSQSGLSRWRGLALYLLSAGLYWLGGMARAALAFDAGARDVRRMSAGDGASLAILLFLGRRAGQMVVAAAGEPGAAVVVETAWISLLAVAAIAYVVRRPAAPPRMAVAPALAVSLVLGAAAAGLAWLGAPGGGPAAGPAVGLTAAGALLISILVEELIFRGVIQRSLEDEGLGCGLAFVVATAVALSAGSAPLSVAAVVAHVAAGAARALTGRVSAAWLARLAAATPLLVLILF